MTTNSKQYAEILSGVRSYIFDIDGTLAALDPRTRIFGPLPGAVEFLDRLTDLGIPYLFFTNGTLHDMDEYVERMNKIGLRIEPSMMLTPISVAINVLNRSKVSSILVLGAEGTRIPLTKAGFEIVLPDASENEIENVDAVLLGWYPDFGLPDISAACKAVWAGAKLFVSSKAKVFATSKGPALGVSGMLAAAVKNATDKPARLLGKPSKLAYRYAAKLLNTSPHEIAVVGDDPALEPVFASAGNGIGIGVETGLGSARDFKALPEGNQPQIIVKDMIQLRKYLK